ncbi:thiopeptide-type bacteriocin biosynthesis protein [Chryseobacterium wangxinyae]|uniref:thiopeptide-type bacteriocin biosynthesis protein n=1 Tax=Chryseobacterium sp. CY353 TaxID=2997334 RepID=UPI00226E9788|nr:thiopeptide-type bacteriocin biosynthesis protein [Chryseobacterium sp. CY353]MCY0971130.1 thiopeptide-type bacteriocin biosynthesis protein [Chryseobacterium sp. CY353]
MNKTKWISAHIYYNELDVIIRESLTTLLNDEGFSVLTEKYFFIRYWDRGAHIRLRVLVRNENEHSVSELINNHFNTFFRKVPSLDFNRYPTFFPNNSIQYIQYIPELKRYGGETGILIAENHFYDSSQFVIKLQQPRSKGKIGINVDDKMSLAIRGNLMMIKSMKMKKPDENNFVFRLSSNLFWKEKLEEFIPKDQLEHKLELDYKKNSEQLKKLYRYVVDLEIDGSDKLFNEFCNALENTRLEICNNISTISSVSRQDLYASYLHMFNNRIGLRNHEEYYLYSMIKKTYDEVYI